MFSADLGVTPSSANYIEDVFSTYLYTGTGASQTISNGVDLSTKGGMVWIKSRSAATNNFLFDTSRGTTKEINSNTTDAEATLANSLTAFNTDGFTVNSATGIGVNAATYASWTFRKQAKFFDVVTYTGNGTANRAIAHNLTSTPGAIFIKRTDSARNWAVYHRSTTAYDYSLRLNTTDAQAQDNYFSAAPDASYFYIDKSPGGDLNVNANGGTYVAYLFAHDAGGFGASGADNVISCGSYTGNGSATGPSVTLGYEPQWILIKQSSSSGNDWQLYDSMRGLVTGDGGDNGLFPNKTATEDTNATIIKATATGFQLETLAAALNASGSTYIYIAIRRGPMKTPTSGTSVFSPVFGTSSGDYRAIYSFAPDMQIRSDRSPSPTSAFMGSRLQGDARLFPKTTGAESTDNGAVWEQTQFRLPGITGDYSGWINWGFRRAPGFFDVVCYTGTGSATTFSHNLGVAPELMIVKSRYLNTAWQVYSGALANTEYLVLNTTAAKATGATRWNSTTPTASVFSLGTATEVNASGATYVAYLFATVAGVSKVGSYTGSGTTKQIDCGFTGGARFVLIKRTDSTGDWYVWDSARGIVAGNDPYLLLNSTAAEVTGTDYVDTYSLGFEISSTAPAAINANGGSFIFLAIA